MDNLLELKIQTIIIVTRPISLSRALRHSTGTFFFFVLGSDIWFIIIFISIEYPSP